MKRKKLIKNIEKLREEIQEAANKFDSLSNEELVEKSQELDELLNKYQEILKE